MATHAQARTNTFVGIDVAKETLRVALLPDDEQRTIANTSAGWSELYRWLHHRAVACLVVEATGPYHVGLWLALGDAGLPVTVVNPSGTKAFARSLGQRAKTDPVDAALLARYAQERQPAPTPLPSDTARQIKELVSCREDLVKLKVMEQHRQQMATALSQPVHEVIIITLRDQITWLERQIADLIASDPALAQRVTQLQTVPGIGRTLSATLIVALPELGALGRTEIASLAGLAPHPQDSGTRHGYRRIVGGRRDVCKALSQMATTANRCNPVIHAHYQQLRSRGKPHKVAVVACARRMLGILTAMLRDGLTWHETKVGQGAFLPTSA